MPNILADRVLESSVSAGTGVFTLAGAVLGFRAFSAVCAVTDTMPYYIEAVDSLGRPTGEWEYGLGTYSAANQLTRTTIRGSSNAGLAVAFSAGTKLVGLGIAAPNSTATRLEWRDALSVYSVAQVNELTPPGSMMDWPASTPPTGWLKRNGASLPTATYAALFAVIGYTYGGAGANFLLPDDRALFPRWWDDGAGIDPARVFGSVQADEFKSHAHGSVVVPVTSLGFDGGALVYTAGNSGSSGATGGTETRPRNRAYLPIIKF